MKSTLLLSATALAFILLLVGYPRAQEQKKMSEQTLQNLTTAMHGEAFAYAKYMLFADHARRAGNTELADLLANTAKTERFEHLAEIADLAGLVSSDTDNLRDAIKGESYETETMYHNFAQQAEQAGDHQAAQRFEEIGRDEAKHRDAFLAALNSLEEKARAGK